MSSGYKGRGWLKPYHYLKLSLLSFFTFPHELWFGLKQQQYVHPCSVSTQQVSVCFLHVSFNLKAECGRTIPLLGNAWRNSMWWQQCEGLCRGTFKERQHIWQNFKGVLHATQVFHIKHSQWWGWEDVTDLPANLAEKRDALPSWVTDVFKCLVGKKQVIMCRQNIKGLCYPIQRIKEKLKIGVQDAKESICTHCPAQNRKYSPSLAIPVSKHRDIKWASNWSHLPES